MKFNHLPGMTNLDENTANFNLTSIPKHFSNWIKCFSRNTNPIADLHYMDNIYRSPADKVKVFNSYFTYKKVLNIWRMPLTLPGMKWPLMHCKTLMMKSVHHSIFISLTSIVVKTLVHCKINSFLSECSKLFPSQHGSRTGHSCQTLPLKPVPQWVEALNRNSSTYIIFL